MTSPMVKVCFLGGGSTLRLVNYYNLLGLARSSDVPIVAFEGIYLLSGG